MFCKLSTPVAYWEYEGYIVDGEKWMEIAREVEQKRDEAAAKVMGTLLPPSYGALFDDDETPEAGDAPFSLTQVEMVRQALERLMGFPVTSLDKDGRANAERDYRARNSGETHPFFKLYAKWSKLNKQSSTYGARFLWAIHPLSGRVHPNFGIAGTNTARFTCRGQNLLNIPTKKGDDDVDFRGAFVAPDGHKWGNADYSAMEQRIAACETGDPVLVALFQSGKDSHSTTAAMMFHLRRDGVSEPVVVEEEFKNGTETQTIKVLLVPAKWDDKKLFEYATSEQVLGYVTKDGTRTVAKMVGFLFYFGGGPYTLAVRTGASERVAEDFFGRYTSTYAVLAAKFEEFGQLPFQNAEVWRDGFEYGYVEAYGGLRRWFRLPKNPSRLDYDNDWKGAAAFKQAQRDYRKQNGAIGREAKNVKTQGGNAMIMAEAILALWESGKPFGVRPWLAIYDELLVQVPEKMPDDMANYLIETSMTEPAEKYMTLVDCVAEASPCTRVWTKH